MAALREADGINDIELMLMVRGVVSYVPPRAPVEHIEAEDGILDVVVGIGREEVRV